MVASCRGRWVRAPSAEDSYCGNPMLLSCSAHEQGSALARPVTVRSAGAVPAPHEAPEPLRRLERVGEVRCYSRLNMGRHQVERIERKPARPRWGWSGVHKIVPPLWAEAALGSVAVLLPSRQSSIEKIVAKLLTIGGRYHRNLHQDEFGPTRAERMQALRDLLDRLEVLLSRLEPLPAPLRLPLSEQQTESLCPAGPIDGNPTAPSCPHTAAIYPLPTRA